MKRKSLFVLSLALVCLTPFLALGQSVAPWAPGTTYPTNALVTFNGQEFKCIQGHTSQVGWEPPNVPALWGIVGPAPGGTPTPTPTPSATPTPPPPPPTPTPTPGGSCFPAWSARQT